VIHERSIRVLQLEVAFGRHKLQQRLTLLRDGFDVPIGFIRTGHCSVRPVRLDLISCCHQFHLLWQYSEDGALDVEVCVLDDYTFGLHVSHASFRHEKLPPHVERSGKHMLHVDLFH
jgi:hypothetical protein